MITLAERLEFHKRFGFNYLFICAEMVCLHLCVAGVSSAREGHKGIRSPKTRVTDDL